MSKYACITLTKGRTLAEVEAKDWFDAVSKFTKMGYSLYKTDVVKIEEDNSNDEG